eukprot:scpid74039/ scgid9949/ 
MSTNALLKHCPLLLYNVCTCSHCPLSCAMSASVYTAHSHAHCLCLFTLPELQESWKVSAKTGVDIEKLFDGLARTLVERAGAIAPRTDHSSRVQLAAEPEPRKCPC